MRKQTRFKISTKSMSYSALLLAISLVLCYVDNLIPELPQGGTILSLSVIPILLASYISGPILGSIVGLMSALLQMALGLVLYYGPWSLLLDYIIPNAVLGLAIIIPSLSIGKNVKIYFGILFSMILRYTSNVLSGVFLFGSSAPEGVPILFYSLAYNLTYNLVTCIFAMIVVPILHKSLNRVPGISNAR